ncbi:hypothetical protein MKEN_00162400 [Mycena kentingensis (nom. inval.)]|nr:hypothetical protein MKEN_00162400 [Mycena kentingensis (nom. inval.)]
MALALELLPVQDLWDLILDHLADSPPALAAAALTHRALTPRAHSLLFATVVVPAEPLACDFFLNQCMEEIARYLTRIRRLTSCLLSAPDSYRILSRIHTLDIHSSSPAIIHLLAGVPFTHLRTLRMTAVPQFRSRELVEDLCALVAVPSLEEVDLRFALGVWYRFTDAELREVFTALAPGVRTLRLASCHPYGDPTQPVLTPTRAHATRPQLRTLALANCAYLPLLHNLDFSRLRELRLADSSSCDALHFLAGTSVEELYVDELDIVIARAALELFPSLTGLVCSKVKDAELVAGIAAENRISLRIDAPSDT